MSQHAKPVIPFWSSESKLPSIPRFTKPNAHVLENPMKTTNVMTSNPIKPKLDHINPVTQPLVSQKPSPPMTLNQAQELAKEDASTFNPLKLIEDLWEKRVLAVKMRQLFADSPSICEASENSVVELEKKIADIDAAIATINSVSESLKKPAKIPNHKVPKCFFVGQFNSQFKSDKWYENIGDFIAAFEQVLKDQDIESVWKEYILVSFSKDLKPWVETDILTCESWSEAKRKLYHRFMSAAKRLEFSQDLMNCKMEKSEVIDVYATRFYQATQMAGYEKEDKLLGQIFFNGLPTVWQSRVHQFMLLRMKLTQWTVSNVYEAVMCVYGRAPYTAIRLEKIPLKRKLEVPTTKTNKRKRPAKKNKSGV